MLKNIKNSVSRTFTNLTGWRTNRKIVVIESDDWGSIRMPSKTAYQNLLNAGIRVDLCHYNQYDSLASEQDLSSLFEVLTKFRDKNGNHPIITANAVVANPDFEKIKDAGFQEYFYEPFTDTLKKYPNHNKSFDLWKQGIEQNIFRPQFHGREHLNVNRWMKALQTQSKETLIAFENNLFGISTTITTEKRKSYLAALDFDSIEELKQQNKILQEGITLFNDIFGFYPLSFIATNYIWHPQIEETLYQSGVKAIQGGNFHNIPPTGKSSRVVRHKLGEKNSQGQRYLIRNAFFEPSENPTKDWIDSCLYDISMAFLFGKPAIICSHRVNFIGYMKPENRDKNLALLENLLAKMLSRWSDIEFMSSEELFYLMTQNGK